MRAEIKANGTLKVTAENELEAYALCKISEDGHPTAWKQWLVIDLSLQTTAEKQEHT